MKLKYTLAAGALALAVSANAQTPEWIADTANLTTGYAKNVFYSLENGSVKSVDANNWHIAIRANVMSVGIFANHASGSVTVYPLTGLSAATSFGTNLTADTAGIVGEALYNALESWEAGAFNMDADPGNQFDYGWGTYDVSTHFITGDKIYLVTTPTQAYQVWIEQDQASLATAHWKFHVAHLDGSNAVTKEFDTHPTYADRLFVYYNLETQDLMDREPASSEWDFEFTKYTEPISAGGAIMMYPVTGVLLNEDRGVVRIAGADAPTATWSTALEANLDSSINIIGRDWKKSSFANGVYAITDSLTYFVQVANGDVWQLEFTYASLGATSEVTPGQVGLRKRKVYTKPEETAVNNVNAYVSNLIVAPNPAVNGTTNLLVDAKQTVKDAQITVADVTGRVISKTTKNISAGFQQIGLDVSQYPAGMYIINLSGKGFSTTQKLVVK